MRKSIRSPPSSWFSRSLSFEGGILNYLEKIDPKESKWKGECFIFDHRVSLVHGLKEGKSQLCFGCRWPLLEEDLKSEKFEIGVSCPKCFDSLAEEKNKAFEKDTGKSN